MSEGPISLGERLRILEQRLEHAESQVVALRGHMAHRSAEESCTLALMDDVVMPMLLVLSGPQHRLRLQRYLSGALGVLHGSLQLDDLLREDMSERIRGWLRAVVAIPEWEPLGYEERHPDAQ